MPLKQKQDAIIEEFSVFDDWMDKYGYLIEMGGKLEPLSAEEKIEENLIDGCQSSLWITAEEKDGRLYFKADSDAIITKGIAALLIRVFEGETPEDIMKSDIYFTDEIGLHQHLSPTRSNGLLAMIKRIKAYAVAYKEKTK